MLNLNKFFIFTYIQIPNSDVECRCKLYGLPRRGTIAGGEVIVIYHSTIIYNSILGACNYKIALTHIIESTTMLFNPNGYHETIGEVGICGFVAWPGAFLDIA